ncbi:MAG: class I SAM-dependent methyltransferase [Anaerolineales bacterium]|nr:class I SAM-dependent methyltransferase [Anaerolineales bacterium]
MFIKTEGVYLGRGVVIWLYDVYASRYDNIKNFSLIHEAAFLSRPLVRATQAARPPLVLDVATGTARLPLTLFDAPDFHGQVIGVDLSRRMLNMAAEKMLPELQEGRLYLLHAPAEHLPFKDASFDLVTCLEALEFTTEPRAVIAELIRVLRPGGILLLSNRQGHDVKYMPGKIMTHTDFQAMLEGDFRLVDVRIQDDWQQDYALVWAFKAGQAPIAGIRPLEDYWRCPHCHQVTLQPTDSGWQCQTCGRTLPIAEDGVIEGVKGG